MKRPRFILSALAILLGLTAATIYYLDWRIPRATATIQILPDQTQRSHTGESSPDSETTYHMTR